jgi:hypothetical protein
MAITYEPIATTTLGTTAASVEFTSIPGTYTDLIVVVSADLDTNNDLRFRINGNTGTDYSNTVLFGDGGSAGSGRDSNLTSGLATYYGQITTTLGDSVQILQFMNYSNTTTNKTVLCRANRASGGVDAIVNLFRSTSAITSLTFAKGSGFTGTWQSGSTFTLYGIKAA